MIVAETNEKFPVGGKSSVTVLFNAAMRVTETKAILPVGGKSSVIERVKGPGPTTETREKFPVGGKSSVIVSVTGSNTAQETNEKTVGTTSTMPFLTLRSQRNGVGLFCNCRYMHHFFHVKGLGAVLTGGWNSIVNLADNGVNVSAACCHCIIPGNIQTQTSCRE